MPKDVAYVQIKLSTTEFLLLKEQLEAQYEYHGAMNQDESLAVQTRAHHRQKAAQIENLLSQLR